MVQPATATTGGPPPSGHRRSLLHPSTWLDSAEKVEFVELSKLAAPVVLSYLLGFSSALVSLMIVGHVGQEALAAGALGNMIMNACGNSIAFGIASACDTLSSQAFGSGNLKRVGAITQRGICILLLCCIPIGGLLACSNYLLSALNLDEKTVELATIYCRLLIPGLPGALTYEILKKHLQNTGIMAPPVIMQSFSILANALLGYTLVYHTSLGFLGAPLSASICQYLLLFMMIAYFRKHRVLNALAWRVRCKVMAAVQGLPLLSSLLGMCCGREGAYLEMQEERGGEAFEERSGVAGPAALAGKQGEEGVAASSSAAFTSAAAAAAAAPYKLPLPASGVSSWPRYDEMAMAGEHAFFPALAVPRGSARIGTGTPRRTETTSPAGSQGATAGNVTGRGSSTAAAAVAAAAAAASGLAGKDALAQEEMGQQWSSNPSSSASTNIEVPTGCPTGELPSTTSPSPSPSPSPSGEAQLQGMTASEIIEATWSPWSRETALSGWWEFFSLGIPSACTLIVEWGSFEVVAIIAGMVSTSTLASHSIIANTASLSFMPILGYSVASAIRVGQKMGAKQVAEARMTYRILMATAVTYVCFNAAFILAVHGVWARIFTEDAEVRELTARWLWLLAIYTVFDAFQCACTGVLRGIGRPFLSAAGNVVSYIAVGIPLAYVLGITANTGVAGIWVGLTMAVLTSFLVLGGALKVLNWEKEAEVASRRALQGTAAAVTQAPAAGVPEAVSGIVQ